jgi:hypothetical protein
LRREWKGLRPVPDSIPAATEGTTQENPTRNLPYSGQTAQKVSHEGGSNSRPLHYECNALPLSYRGMLPSRDIFHTAITTIDGLGFSRKVHPIANAVFAFERK